jgi:hypothetical protein
MDEVLGDVSAKQIYPTVERPDSEGLSSQPVGDKRNPEGLHHSESLCFRGAALKPATVHPCL